MLILNSTHDVKRGRKIYWLAPHNYREFRLLGGFRVEGTSKSLLRLARRAGRVGEASDLAFGEHATCRKSFEDVLKPGRRGISNPAVNVFYARLWLR